MKKGRKGRKLGRKRDARSMLLRNLATSIVLYEKVTTTLAKAKAVQPILEKKLSRSLKGDLSVRRSLLAFFTDRNAVKKIFSELIPSYKSGSADKASGDKQDGKRSGFTRITRLGYRVGDGAPKVQIQLIIPDELEVKRKKKAKEARQLAEKAKSLDKARDREKVKKKPQDKIKTRAKVKTTVKDRK